jgi:hypothetical protein
MRKIPRHKPGAFSVGRLVILVLAGILLLALFERALSALLLLVLLAGLGVLVFGLVRNRPARVWGVAAVLSFAAVVSLGYLTGTLEGDPSTPRQGTETPAEESRRTPAPEPESSRTQPSPQEFRTAWNSASAEADAGFVLPELTVESGEGQDYYFRHAFTEELAILGTVAGETGRTSAVTIAATPTDPISTAEMLLAWGVLIGTLNPDLSAAERGEVLEDLGVREASVDLYDLDASTRRGGVRYAVSGSEGSGIVFVAELPPAGESRAGSVGAVGFEPTLYGF